MYCARLKAFSYNLLWNLKFLYSFPSSLAWVIVITQNVARRVRTIYHERDYLPKLLRDLRHDLNVIRFRDYPFKPLRSIKLYGGDGSSTYSSNEVNHKSYTHSGL